MNMNTSGFQGEAGRPLRVCPLHKLCPLVIGTIGCVVLSACHQPSERPYENRSIPTATTEEHPTIAPPGVQIRDDLHRDSPRWLFAERASRDIPDARPTGSFNRKRNKISVESHGVLAFAIDMSRLKINWERLVVLSIDGKNSELRKRDYSIYHFKRDAHGRWIVVED